MIPIPFWAKEAITLCPNWKFRLQSCESKITTDGFHAFTLSLSGTRVYIGNHTSHIKDFVKLIIPHKHLKSNNLKT